MKRDLELIRTICGILAEAPDRIDLSARDVVDSVPGDFSVEYVQYQFFLMQDAGFAEEGGLSRRTGRTLSRLTWSGQEFHEAAKDATVWSKAKTKLNKAVEGASFGVLTEVLKDVTLKQLGLK